MKNIETTTLYYFDFVGTYGGAQQSTVTLLNNLHKRYNNRLEIYVLSVDGTNAQFVKNIETSIVTLKINVNLNIFKVGRKYMSAMLYLIESSFKAKKAINITSRTSRNIVLCNSSKALYAVSLLKLISFNNDVYFYSRGSGDEKNFNFITKFILNNIVKEILCVSSQTKENMNRFIVNQSKVNVTYTSVDFEKLDKFYYLKPIDFNNLKILFAGALIPAKGLKLLLLGIGQLPKSYQEKITVSIAGNDKPSEVQNYIEECMLVCSTIACHVNWLGWRDDVPKLISENDIVCLPSSSEGLPRIIQESMYLGKIVMCTPVGGVPELIKNGENGYLIDQESSLSIKECLLECFMSSKVDSIRENARLYIKRNFNLDKQTKLVLDLMVHESK